MVVSLVALVALAADPGGQPGGIGAKLAEKAFKDYPGVTLPFAGSPAEKAGLLPGDAVTAVDGWSTAGQPIAAVVAHIAGPVGTRVVLSVVRDRVPRDVAVVRASTAALAAEQTRIEREICPALWEALRGDDVTFADLRGAPAGEDFDAKTPLPTAERTRIESGLGSTSWRAQFGTYPPAEIERRFDEVVTRLRPCLEGHWISREREDGRPVAYFGRATAVGWLGTRGAFRARKDGVVDVYVTRDRPLGFIPLVEPAQGPWATALPAIVAASADGFTSLRGAPHTEGGPFNSWTWYEATTALPGAADCRVQTPSTMVPGDTYYQCTIARNIDPATVAATFDKAEDLVIHSLGPGWVMWTDPEPGPHERSFQHFGRRSTRGYERTGVVTLGLSETGVTVSVSQQGVY